MLFNEDACYKYFSEIIGIDIDSCGSCKDVYFRIQPSSLEITNHKSVTSCGDTADGLHVFTAIHNAFDPNGAIEDYGDSLFVIKHTGGSWDTGDCEGEVIQPDDSTEVIARLPWSREIVDSILDRFAI